MEVHTWRQSELIDQLPNFDWNHYEEERENFYFHQAQPALIGFYTFLWIIGALGNVWVAFVVGYLLIKRRSRRTGDAPLTVQIYIFGLCLCDLLVLAFLPLLLLDLIYGSWKIPSSILCKFYLLSEGFNKFGAPWLLTALSSFVYSNIRRMARLETKDVDQSLNGSQRKISSTSSCSTIDQRKLSLGGKRHSTASVLHHPIKKDNGRKSAMILFLCAIAVILAMSPVFIYADVHFIVAHNESQLHILAMKCAFQPSDTILTTFTIYSFVGGYLCPAFLFTYYYSAILFYIRRRRRGLRNMNSLSGNGCRSQQRYCRVAKTAIGLVLWTLAGWTPYWAYLLYFYFHPQTDAEEINGSTAIILSYFVHMIPYLNVTAYPILLTFTTPIRTAYARTKMAAMNRRRRKRFASVGEIGLTNSSSGSSSRRPIRSSLDYSTTIENVTQIGERTISFQFDENSSRLYQYEDCISDQTVDKSNGC